MKKIYIIATNTGTYFSKFLKLVTKEKYVHVSIALDKNYNKVYSFGRKNPKRMLPAGFVNENFNEICKLFDNTICQIYELKVTNKQYYEIKQSIKNDYIKNAVKYKYNLRGLPLIKLNFKHNRKHHYVCSQFCGKLLIDTNIADFKKDYSLVKPIDILSMPGLKLIYEGRTIDYINEL